MKNERLASSISLLCCLLLVLPIQGFVSVAPSSQPIPSLDVAAASTFIKLHPKTVLYAQAPSQKDAVLERPASSLSVSSSSSESTLDPSVVVVDGSSFSTPVDNDENNNNQEYQRGLWTIGFCTIVFASLSPAMHAALSSTSTAASDIVSCPVIFLNAVLSVVALVCLAVAGPSLETMIPPPSALVASSSTTTSPTEPATEADKNPLASWWNSIDVSVKAGSELGFWKFLGTMANLYGLALTTADHGAFLIQLTTLIVPTVQGLMGIPIPRRIQFSIVLALMGMALFTQDMGGAGAAALDPVVEQTRLQGDALCVVAAAFYATYDLRLFAWGKQVAARPLITSKIASQALLSFGLLFAVGIPDATDFVQQFTAMTDEKMHYLVNLAAISVWSGCMVKAIVPFLQVGGQQAIGATRAQTVYASQPLWAALLSFVFEGETVGTAGLVGGGAFVSALFLAATAQAPEADCDQQECEI